MVMMKMAQPYVGVLTDGKLWIAYPPSAMPDNLLQLHRTNLLVDGSAAPTRRGFPPRQCHRFDRRVSWISAVIHEFRSVNASKSWRAVAPSRSALVALAFGDSQ
jgi:hypothetical protein